LDHPASGRRARTVSCYESETWSWNESVNESGSDVGDEEKPNVSWNENESACDAGIS
jgi:hypothetical protein